ncbi:MAG TPA: VWA domain-containing protein [Vicinamibacteria bacterium]|nr:VWA domain-containing protein [Vicinamibacteria bacterium]
MLFPASLLALALAADPQAAEPAPAVQQPPVKPFTVEVDVDVVSVTAVVFDKSGKFVRGLGPKDVELLEGGVKQEVSYFREASSLGEAAERVPLSVVLVLDTSGSMNENIHFLQEAVLNFVYKMDEVDSALVVSFNESVKGSAEFSGDVDRLERFVEGLQAWGGTSLYDAIHYSLGRIKDQPGRKAIIVFSDGADTTSSMEDREVVDYARAVEATVYSIGFRGSGSMMSSSPRGFLRKIATETGGQYFAPDKVGELIKVFNAISEELKNHYLLAYTPKRAADGTWREIALKVNRPDTEVRVRKGYFALKRRRTAD